MSLPSRFFLLAPAQRSLLVKAALLLCAVQAVLLFFPIPFLRRLFSLRRARRLRGSPDPGMPDRIAWAVAAASRFVPGSHRCLPRAMAAHLWLVRAGHPAVLRVGVAKPSEGKLLSHAWVECEGKVLMGKTTRAVYTPVLVSKEESE